MKKKVVALLLTATMALSFVACGNKTTAKESEVSKKETPVTSESKTESIPVSEQSDPVLLRIFMSDYVKTDEAKVSAYINELPQVKEMNVEIEMVKIENTEYNEKIPLIIASDEQMDIGFDNGDAFLERIRQEAYYDLTDLLANDAEFVSRIPDTFWAGSKVDGGIWGIPNWKDNGIQYALYAETAFLEENNIDPTTIADLKDAEVILEACKKAGRAGFHVTGKWDKNSVVQADLLDEYDILASTLVCINREEGKTMLSTYETEAFLEHAKLMRSWNEKGYIANDALTRSNYKDFIEQGLYGLGFIGYAPLAEVASSKNAGVELTPMTISGPPIAEANFRQGSLCVYNKSKNPELAYEFIKLVNTDAEVKNAFVYGIPGDHYNLVDGQVERTEGATDRYNTYNYRIGDMRNSYTLVGESKDKWDVYQKWNDDSIVGADFGFAFDTEPVTTQIANCNAVLAEYLTPISLGFVEDTEAGIEALVTQLKAAGIDEIVAECQAQFDAFKANK